MFLAIAAEASKHPHRRNDYKVWYLELDDHQEVVGIGVKSREQLIESLFEQYRQTGRSHWRAFPKHAPNSKEIDLTDFISHNIYENTHFGDLPNMGEFQETLDCLKLNMELKAIA